MKARTHSGLRIGIILVESFAFILKELLSFIQNDYLYVKELCH